MDDRDWGKIKTEYVTGLSSYRELAEKYGIGKSVLTKRAIAEKWVEARNQYRTKTEAKAQEKIGNRQAERMARLQEGAELMLGKIMRAVNIVEPENLLMDSKLARSLTGAMRDLKEVMDCKSELDIDEQKARIEKLRKEIEGDKVDNGITLVIEGGEEAWKT